MIVDPWGKVIAEAGTEAGPFAGRHRPRLPGRGETQAAGAVPPQNVSERRSGAGIGARGRRAVTNSRHEAWTPCFSVRPFRALFSLRTSPRRRRCRRLRRPPRGRGHESPPVTYMSRDAPDRRSENRPLLNGMSDHPGSLMSRPRISTRTPTRGCDRSAMETVAVPSCTVNVFNEAALAMPCQVALPRPVGSVPVAPPTTEAAAERSSPSKEIS